MDGAILAGTRTRRGMVLSLLREPLRRRTWAELRYVIVSLPVAIAGCVWAVISAVIGVVGFVVLAGLSLTALSLTALSSAGTRGFAAVNHSLAGRLLGTRVTPLPQFRPRSAVRGWLWSGISDAAGWRVRAYLVLKLPVAAAGYLIAGWVGGAPCLTRRSSPGCLARADARTCWAS
jgi:hypothetical protein